MTQWDNIQYGKHRMKYIPCASKNSEYITNVRSIYLEYCHTWVHIYAKITQYEILNYTLPWHSHRGKGTKKCCLCRDPCVTLDVDAYLCIVHGGNCCTVGLIICHPKKHRNVCAPCILFYLDLYFTMFTSPQGHDQHGLLYADKSCGYLFVTNLTNLMI